MTSWFRFATVRGVPEPQPAEEQPAIPEEDDGWLQGTGLAIGLCLGTVLGLTAFDNIGVGLGLGVALGVALDAARGRRRA